MKVAFDFTLDDAVDLAERASERSATAKGLRSQAQLVTSVAAAVIVWFLIPGPDLWRWLGAGVAAVLGACFYPGSFKNLHRKKLRKYFLEEFGGEGPFRCEVELTPEGLVTDQAGTRTVRGWSTVVAVQDFPESVDFITRGSGSVAVRNRAFASPGERAEFIRLALGYANNGGKK